MVGESMEVSLPGSLPGRCTPTPLRLSVADVRLLGVKNSIRGTKQEGTKAGFAVKIVLMGIAIAAIGFVGWVIYRSVTSFLLG